MTFSLHDPSVAGPPLAGLRLEDAGVGQVREYQLRRTPAATQGMELLQVASGAPRRRRWRRSTREVDL